MNETREYEIFKIYPGNRPIDNANLQNLILSISTKNLLKERPIVVNEFYEVLDGQHRLEAAKTLQIPVFYTIKEKGGFKDIILLNNSQKSWKLDDYLRLYADGQKLTNYIKVQDFINRHNLKLKEGLLIIHGPFKEMKEDVDFKNGELTFSVSDEYLENLMDKIKYVINLIASHNIKPLHRFKNTAFIKPLILFVTNERMNWEIFQQKLQDSWFKIGTRPSTNLYLEMLCDIYNMRNQNKIFFEAIGAGR